MVRRIAFIGGLILGSGICAFTLGVILTYLFTGQVIAITATRGQGVSVKLFDMNSLRQAPVGGAE